MSANIEALGTFTCLVTEDDSIYQVADSPDRIDAQAQEWVSSGWTRDCWVELTMLDGDRLRLKASDIRRLVTSTPEGRRNAIFIQKAMADEMKEHRALAGYLPGEDFD